MKKEHLILLSVGAMLAFLLVMHRRSVMAVIKPGDKGNDVKGLQVALSSVSGVRIDNPGAYDNSTLLAVQDLLKGTSALVNFEKGYVDRGFASDLFLMQSNANK